MAKKIPLLLLCCAVYLASSPVFATNEPVMQSHKADECNAPAPADFNITSIGGNFIALVWIPVWVGANHTLDILENDGAGGWITIETINNVPGSSYTVEDLESGKEYRFILATNCSNGEPSELKSVIDGITLIIDLAIIGRNPNNPVAVDCSSIPLNQNWVGFKVEYVSSGISIVNLFELVVVEANSPSNNFFSKVEIRRVYRVHPIVAIDQDEFWPNCDNPLIPNVGTPFRMARLFGNGPNKELIGWLNLVQNSSSSISICPDYNHPILPWKNAYKFTALVSSKANNMPGCGNRSDNITAVYADLKAQSPFDQTLHVFFPPSFSENNNTNIRLLNAQGQMVLDQKLEIITTEVALPVRILTPGIYILQVESEGEVHSLKVIKV